MIVKIKPEDIAIDDKSANAINWHANQTRLFIVTYRDSGRGIDIKSATGRHPAMNVILGIIPWQTLVDKVSRIPGVIKAYIDENQPNILIVETQYCDGRNWASVEPRVKLLILEHFCPSRQQRSRFGRRRKTAVTP